MAEILSKTLSSKQILGFKDISKTPSIMIKKAPFGKMNKSVEDVVVCFLYSNEKYLEKNNIKSNCLDEASEKHSKYLEKMYKLLFECPEKSSLKNEETIVRLFTVLLSENNLSTIIRIISNLNEYNQSELKQVYKIIKAILKFPNICSSLSRSICPTSLIERLKKCLAEQINNIVEALLDNIRPSEKVKSDSVVFIVGKLFRTLFKQDYLFQKILNFNFFTNIYFYMKSDKFVISNEALKIIESIICNKKISKKIWTDFLNENKQIFCELINSTIDYKLSKKECDLYFLYRESLKLLLDILNDSENFHSFRDYYLDDLENLKLVMCMMNHSCMRIKYKAVNLLYLFFSDLECRSDKIKNLLFKNKNNFEKYFSRFNDNFTTNINNCDSDFSEKSNFILYQLERLENI